MRFSGRIFKDGRFWLIEVPVLGVMTQGFSRKEAYFMIADAIESLVNDPDFSITVFPGQGDYFEIAASSDATLIAFMLRRERLRSGLTLLQVAERLGARSANAYGRYEQGRSMPTIQKLSELLAAVSSGEDFVLNQSRVKASRTKRRGNTRHSVEPQTLSK